MPSLTKVQTGFLEPQGAFELTPGTSSSPGLFFTGNTSTGMFSPSSGVLGFSTGSTQQALTILADGKVGIANANPTEGLVVSYNSQPAISIKNSGAYAAYGLSNTGTNGRNWGLFVADTNHASFWPGSGEGAFGIFDFTGNGSRYVITSGGDHIWRSSTGEKLRVTSAGNVGIGTDNPQGKLHISSGTSGDCELIIEADTDNNNENDNPRILFRQDGGNDLSAIGSGINEGTANNALVLANSVSVNGGIIFKTNNNDAGYTEATEKLRITSAGNVGIGTTAPASKLHVEGNSLSLINRVDNANTYITAENTGAGNAGLKIKNANGEWTFIANDRLRVIDNDANIERFSIASTGNVIIQDSTAVGAQVSNAGLLIAGKAIDASTTTIDTEIDTSSLNNGVSLHLKAAGNANNQIASIIFDHGALRSGIAGGRILTNQWGTDLRFYTHPASVSNLYMMYERLRINSEGNVGIGTTNPGYKLHTQGTIFSSANVVAGTTFNIANVGGNFSGSGGTENWLGIKDNSGNWGLVMKTFGTNVGSVGIGTTNPISELMVENATQSHITVKTTGSNMAKFGSKGNDVYIGGTANATNIIFKRNIVSTDHPADSGTETLRIDSSGNVGIGTINPQFKLHMGSAVTIPNSRYLTDFDAVNEISVGNHNIMVSINDSSATSSPESVGLILHNDSNTNNTFSPAIAWGSRSSSNLYSQATAAIAGRRTVAVPGDANWHGGELHFYTSLSSGGIGLRTRMVISDTGNVGIGTTNPVAKLDVRSGGIVAGQSSSAIASMTGISTGGSAPIAYNTGISINQGGAGGSMLLLASVNSSSGTATNSAVYLIRFYYDGNNTPTSYYIAGSSNFVSVSKSASNTLVLTSSLGGNVSYSWFGNKGAQFI